MAITNIKMQNFKSFKELEVNLGVFNVLIGANASGKSNFIQFFQFIKHIIDFGLDNAISMQGGVEYLKSFNTDFDKNLSFAITSDLEYGHGIRTKGEELIGIKFIETIYEFSLGLKKGAIKYKVINDKIIQKCNFIRLERKNGKIKEKEQFGKGSLIFSNNSGKVTFELNKPDDVHLEKEDILPSAIVERGIDKNSLLIESPFLYFTDVDEVFLNMGNYDFDPKLPKKSTPITGKADLEEDGSNLSIVLKNIISAKESKRKFKNLIKDILPFIDDIDIQKFADKSLLFKIKETYFKDSYLPASLISDGTISIVALIIALFFEKKSLTIIEEPERNIHPYLISRVVEYMKDAAKEKQIIVTTHNPEVVKQANLNDLLLVSRDEEGYSTIFKPSEKEEVKIFLENEMGIDELYVGNLLEM